MVPGHLSDQPQVSPTEAEQFAVLNEVHRVFVVAGDADKQTDLVQQSRQLQHHAVAIVQAMLGLQSME